MKILAVMIAIAIVALAIWLDMNPLGPEPTVTPRPIQIITVTDSTITTKLDSTYALLKRMDTFIRE